MSPGVFALFIPIIIFMIPIVAILTKHQQRMAEIMAEGHRTSNTGEVMALRHEVAELKALVHQQAIAMDSLSSRPLSSTAELRDRVGA